VSELIRFADRLTKKSEIRARKSDMSLISANWSNITSAEMVILQMTSNLENPYFANEQSESLRAYQIC
jgi:hypothetical protein